ncbi:geranylgeranyl diphosphate synthase type I [Stackebrandtia endophytica]|uniref:Geranylgeranyl diphosphate synthase type I n=1 Tax=Stackebrandtia endophytica TaxID=1496996 RepID=A0A543B2P3_9ACTN|nr:polyprenyl synthetase family protein [Stackebrandtia endophytica]TQL79098.1 geranylgeranyl diphosphate synthase type I [Stackebrandtia endophytica]
MRSPIERANLVSRVEEALSVFLTKQRDRLTRIDAALTPIADSAEMFILGGGKRIRPAFAYWGYRGAGGADDDTTIACVASLELLQASALIHDDLMDDSDTRRGEPSVHRRFANRHSTENWAGPAEEFGAASAILLGDLCMTWSDELFSGAGMPAERISAARDDFDAMRTEVCAGQFLDVLNQVQRDNSIERALKVARYKSAKYTIERPLLMGAALAGGSDRLREIYSAYGLPLGEAFQLRDDVLGVFGDPEQTGKPAGDDLREGKHTFLIASAYQASDQAGRRLLDGSLGDPELSDSGIEALRELITATGALATTEERIDRLADQSAQALRDGKEFIADEAAVVLDDLADAAVRRSL